MILVDTSVWVSHFRTGNQQLESLLNSGQVICHPFIIGELACGTLKNRIEILNLLRSLPQADCADDDEVLHFIEKNHLMGKGLGYIDMHLLASAILTNVPIWTLDKKLRALSSTLDICFDNS